MPVKERPFREIEGMDAKRAARGSEAGAMRRLPAVEIGSQGSLVDGLAKNGGHAVPAYCRASGAWCEMHRPASASLMERSGFLIPE